MTVLPINRTSSTGRKPSLRATPTDLRIDVGDHLLHPERIERVAERRSRSLRHVARPQAARIRRQPISIAGPCKSKGVSRTQPMSDI